MVIARRNVPNIACCTSTVLTKPPLEKSGLKVALLRFIELSRPETSLLYMQHAGQRFSRHATCSAKRFNSATKTWRRTVQVKDDDENFLAGLG